MIATLINRKQVKQEVRTLLADAQVSPKAMVALYSGLILVLNMLEKALMFHEVEYILLFGTSNSSPRFLFFQEK